jgi:cupin 2 domain-containing protein
MALTIRNLLNRSPESSEREVFQPLVDHDQVRIERIVSHGQASPAGFWYDQPNAEWVALLAGTATLVVEGEGAISLQAGDSFLVPARLKHRVDRTSPDAIWLAVHFAGGEKLQ